jgi:hypothetical protein
VVERRHERRASLGGEPRRDRLPVVALAVVENDFGAVSARAVELRPRRVVRHDDRRSAIEPLSCDRDRLRVVPRRECDDAGAALRVTQLKRPVQRAADLEAAAAL